MKEVYVGREDFTAQLIKAKLEDVGIECCVLNDYLNNVLPYASGMASMAIQVVVADEDYEQAMDIIGAVNKSKERSECPFCGSTDIVYDIKGRSRISKIVVVIWSVLTFSPIGKLQCNYYCNSCKEEF